MKLPETKFYPEAVPDKWDNIEIDAIIEDNDGNCEVVHATEETPNPEIDFYSVYLHDVDGGVMCIADCKTEIEAIVLKELLTKTVLNYVDNGYLKL